MPERASLRTILIECFEAGEALQRYFSRAQAAGYSLAAALDALEFSAWPDEIFLWVGDEEVATDDPIASLAQHLGSLDETQEVVDASEVHRGTSVAAYLARIDAYRALGDAFRTGAPAADVLALLRAPQIEDPLGELVRLARTRPILEIVELDVRVTEVPALAEGLAGRMDASEALEHLVAEGLPLERVLSAAARYWNAPTSTETDPFVALVDVTAQLYSRIHRPVRDVIPLAKARLCMEVWLPVLRRAGLGPSAAVLHLTERADPISVADAAHVLLQAGYTDDEVLRGLLENGVSTRESLDLLRAEGWDVSRVTTTLVRRGTLLSDVRNHLVTLGVPASAQRVLLARYAQPDVLDVVLGDGAPRGRLGPGEREE